MSFSAPVQLDRKHALTGFDCSHSGLNEWLIRHAMQSQSAGSAKTFVVLEGATLAGYFSLTVGQIDSVEAPDRIRQGMGRYPIPVVILARMAVAVQYQGLGIGKGMLQDAIRRTLLISEQAGIRALLTHPIDAKAAKFYLQFGFLKSPILEGQLILLLKDARFLLDPSPRTKS